MKLQKNFAAKLRNKVELMLNLAADDMENENWVKLDELYVEIVGITETNIKEFDSVNFGHVMSEEYYIITSRYNEKINCKMRIQFKDRIFVIKRVLNPFELNQLTKMIVLEITER